MYWLIYSQNVVSHSQTAFFFCMGQPPCKRKKQSGYARLVRTNKGTIILKQDTNIMMHPGIISNILPQQRRVMFNIISKVSFKSETGLPHSSS